MKPTIRLHSTVRRGSSTDSITVNRLNCSCLTNPILRAAQTLHVTHLLAYPQSRAKDILVHWAAMTRTPQTGLLKRGTRISLSSGGWEAQGQGVGRLLVWEDPVL